VIQVVALRNLNVFRIVKIQGVISLEIMCKRFKWRIKGH